MVRSIHVCRKMPGMCGYIVHWWDVSPHTAWFRKMKNYISRRSALCPYLCKFGNEKCICTWKGEQRDCLVLPLARAAPFELLGLWCPSSLLLGFRGRGVEVRCCASVKHRLRMRLAFVIFLFALSHSSLPLLSNSPAGFSQMEVAQHSCYCPT